MRNVKNWITGGISAVIACLPSYLPSSVPSCIGTTCGACPASCFSGLGVIWLAGLYLRNAGSAMSKHSMVAAALVKAGKLPML